MFSYLEDLHPTIRKIEEFKIFLSMHPELRTWRDMLTAYEVHENLDELLVPLEDTCYTDNQLAEIGIQYVIGYRKPLRKYDHLYPFFRNDDLYEYEVPDTSIRAINIPRAQIMSIQRIRDTSFGLPSVDYRYYYHATSWRSALNIIDIINRGAGRECLDFGSLPGFYVSPTLNHSIEWCEKNKINWFNECAILVFHVPKEIPKSINFLHLTGDAWSSVVKFSRRCMEPDRDARELRHQDLIYGPMVANVRDFPHTDAKPVTHSKPRMQLVSKSDVGDRFLHSCLKGCFFLEKEQRFN